MLLLGPTDSLSGKAGTDAVITVTGMGDALVSGADTFKVLFQAQLGTSVGTLLAATAGQQSLVKTLVLANTSSDPVSGVQLYVNGTGAANRITGSLMIPADGWAQLDAGGWKVFDQNGTIQ